MSLLPALDESEQGAGHGWSTSSRFGIDQQTNQSSNIYHLISQNNAGEVPDALVEEEVLDGEDTKQNISSSQNQTANVQHILHEQLLQQQQVPENQPQQQKNSPVQQSKTVKTPPFQQSQSLRQPSTPQPTHSAPHSLPQSPGLKQPLHLTQKVSYSVLHQQQQGIRAQQPKANALNQFYSPRQQSPQIPMAQQAVALYHPQQLVVTKPVNISSSCNMQTDGPAGMSEEEINLELQRQQQQIELNKQKLALLGVTQTHTSLQSMMVPQHLLTTTDYMTIANTSQQFSDVNQEVLQNSQRKFEIQFQDSGGNNISLHNVTNHVIPSSVRLRHTVPLNSLSGHKPNILSSQQLRPIIQTNLQTSQSSQNTSYINQSPVQVLSVSTNQNQPLDNTIPVDKINSGNVVLEGGGQFEEGQAYMIRDCHGNTRKMIWKNGDFYPMSDEVQIQNSAIDSSQRGQSRGSRVRDRGRSNILRNATTSINIGQPGGRGVSSMINNGLRHLQQTTNINRYPSMLNHPSSQLMRDLNPNIFLQHSEVQGPMVSVQQSTTALVPQKPLLNKTALQVLMPAAQVTQKYVNTETVQPRSAGAEDKQLDVSECQSNISTDMLHVKENPDPPNIPPDPNAVAVCQYCGYTSEDKLKCESCKRKFTSATKYVIKNNLTNQDPNLKRRKIDSGCAAMTAPVLDKKMFYGNKLTEGKIQVHSQKYVHVFKSVNSSIQNTVTVVRSVPGLRRGRGRGRGRGVLVPETVTISSDEEEPVSEDNAMLQTLSVSSTAHLGQSQSPSQATEPGLDCPESPLIPTIPTNKRIVSRGIDRMEDAKGSTPLEREKSVSPVEMMLNARNVRVGTFKGVPVEPILIAKTGLNFYIEGVSGTHKFHIYPHEIQQCLANLDMQNCLIFFLTTQGCAVRTRKDLNIATHTNPSCPPPEPYFDPLGCYMCHQMITITLDQVDKTTKSEFYKYMDIFKSCGKQGDEGFFMELSASEANDILNQSIQTVLVQQSPVPIMPVIPDRVYSQQGEDDQHSRSPSPPKKGFAGPVIKLLTYPPPPEKGGISITNEDLYCLQEGEFLNDVIIDFYLKYLLLEKLSPEDRARTHIFSSFFYKRLTQRIRGAAIDDDPCLTLPEKRHARVKTWTRYVDLFKKDFVIIPINEHAHWFLAIVCFPGLENIFENPFLPKLITTPLLEPGPGPKTPPQPTDDNTENMETEESKNLSSATTNVSKTSVPQETTSNDTDKESIPFKSELQTAPDNGTQALKNESVKTSVEAENKAREKPSSEDAEDKVDQSSGIAEATDKGNGELENKDAKCVKSNGISTTKIVVLSRGILGKAIEKSDSLPEDAVIGYKQPCIIIFDSLSGPPRNRIVQVLKEYLQVEWTVKRSGTELNKALFKGCVPKVPQQCNFSDCGVYMLQYVERFFEDPIQDFSTPMKGLHDWFSIQQINCKREEMRDLIISLKEKYESKIVRKEKA